MNRITDVIVAGNGLAGLMAAYAAVKKGATVQVVSEGMGNLSISPGCIDVLGYDPYGQSVANPYEALAKLPEDHPYSLVGKDEIANSLAALCECTGAKGYKLTIGKDSSGQEKNTLMPTVMGTLKPSWCIPAEVAEANMEAAKKILVISIKGFRDCKPKLIESQLARYPGWADKTYETLVLPAPFDEMGRSINALDLAHFADRGEGMDWLLNRLRGIGKDHDLALLPPLLGAKPDSRIRMNIHETIGCPVVEMLSVPPGVGGLRIRSALIDTLISEGVEFFENAHILSADVADGQCKSLKVHSTGRNTELEARAVVVATGGIIGGGLLLDQGKATEAIFGLDVPVPQNVDEWSQPEIFGQHLITRIGVRTDADLKVPELKNVFFAGRILGGYDWASEKSGHGVACATGWKAGSLAADLRREVMQ